MKRRIFSGMCLVAVSSALLTCICITGILYKSSLDHMRTSVHDQATYVSAAYNMKGMEYLKEIGSITNRLTLIAPDGFVIYDSDQDASAMGNHRDRPEVAHALAEGQGEAERLSKTLAIQSYYYAVVMDDGNVLRVTGEVASVYGSVLRYLPLLVLVSILSAMLAAILAQRLTAKLIHPINTLNLEDPLSNDVYDELSPLLRRIDKQRIQIREQLSQLRENQDEFSAISENMSEGMILLGPQATVLSINQSARRALELGEQDYIGKHILNLNRSLALQSSVQKALEGNSWEEVLSMDGRQFQLLVSPVRRSDEVTGVVLLLLDITEKLQNEQMRREFSANVSHELKTPLTSISGYAEIMQNGLVKPEDMQQFAGRIYSEAKRLIALVEDIMELSRLDERSAGDVQREPVDLLELSNAVMGRLASIAESKNLTVSVTGQPGVVSGIPRILEDMVFNLCDNAIKYNIIGGRVDIEVESLDTGISLSVSDTGIGIAKEHQSRVFERFYRVDKSHSRITGGTGLGLSIVKHAALYHGGKVALASEPGIGTQITVTLPR
ncbi:ATP-binding protein [Oscillospiraceae bacterium MB08-C2-2]|nr:ATP-binding protein [Oscillospiraceae bacterium MB08-C2-2]